jgi:hypothetical protein
MGKENNLVVGLVMSTIQARNVCLTKHGVMFFWECQEKRDISALLPVSIVFEIDWKYDAGIECITTCFYSQTTVMEAEKHPILENKDR